MYVFSILSHSKTALARVNRFSLMIRFSFVRDGTAHCLKISLFYKNISLAITVFKAFKVCLLYANNDFSACV